MHSELHSDVHLQLGAGISNGFSREIFSVNHVHKSGTCWLTFVPTYILVHLSVSLHYIYTLLVVGGDVTVD